ncbi:unnamed protein product [Owenia fusiformis]|uniref:Uncharacterized protein n=1 Tax=Owenia fusiformis TaxID=6347 RepID=A0A8J1T6W6_OWEFU|nr:unnamed protein product [Owenia fusiformis]
MMEKLLIFGHSLIHWLDDFQKAHMNNLELNSCEFEINYVGIRGGQFKWNEKMDKKYQEKSLFSYLTEAVNDFKPTMVFLQLGGNDLDVKFPDSDQVVTAIFSFANYLIFGMDVQTVVIGHVFRRLKPRYMHYNATIEAVNNTLTEKASSSNNIYIMPNKGFKVDAEAKYYRDGIHLSHSGNVCFANNIRRKEVFARDHSYAVCKYYFVL